MEKCPRCDKKMPRGIVLRKAGVRVCQPCVDEIGNIFGNRVPRNDYIKPCKECGTACSMTSSFCQRCGSTKFKASRPRGRK